MTLILSTRQSSIDVSQLQNSEDVDISNKNSVEQECVEDCPWPEQTVLELFVAR